MTQLLQPPSAAPRWARLQQRWSHTLLGPAVTLAAATGGMAVLQVADPNTPGHYPTCPFLAVTGLFCPGCGSMRMLHDLGAGDLVGAFWMNPLAFVLLPVLAGYWLSWAHRAATGARRGAPLAGPVVWAFLVVVVVFGVLRNLPGLELLAPG